MINQAGSVLYKESPYNNFTQYRKDSNFFVTKKYLPAKEEKSHKLIITLATSVPSIKK